MLLLCLVCFGRTYLISSSDALLRKANDISLESVFSNGDGAGLQSIRSLCTEWERRRTVVSVFVPLRLTEEIDTALIHLSASASHGDRAMFSAALAQFLQKVPELYQYESITLESIF